MDELVFRYWWVSIFTVPALAFAIRAAMERWGAVDLVRSGIRSKLLSFEPSYPGAWMVSVTLRDGRRFSKVLITDRFQLSQRGAPFRLRDISDVTWEGYAEAGSQPDPLRMS